MAKKKVQWALYLEAHEKRPKKGVKSVFLGHFWGHFCPGPQPAGNTHFGRNGPKKQIFPLLGTSMPTRDTGCIPRGLQKRVHHFPFGRPRSRPLGEIIVLAQLVFQALFSRFQKYHSKSLVGRIYPFHRGASEKFDPKIDFPGGPGTFALVAVYLDRFCEFRCFDDQYSLFTSLQCLEFLRLLVTLARFFRISLKNLDLEAKTLHFFPFRLQTIIRHL